MSSLDTVRLAPRNEETLRRHAACTISGRVGMGSWIGDEIGREQSAKSVGVLRTLAQVGQAIVPNNIPCGREFKPIPRPSFPALDPAAQIRLFGKLKLMNCANSARPENQAGCLFDQVRAVTTRRAIWGAPRGRPLMAEGAHEGRPCGRQAPCCSPDIFCYSRPVAAHVPELARENLRPCKSPAVYRRPP
jgi:hypothetical protein